MKKTTYGLIQKDKELSEIYKRYLKRIRDIEKNLTNRTPMKLELYCRWLRVSGKKGNNSITCKYGQNPDLKECVECYGIIYNNIELSRLEEALKKAEKYVERDKDPKFKNIYDDMIKFAENKIKEYMKKSMLKFLKKTDDMVK